MVDELVIYFQGSLEKIQVDKTGIHRFDSRRRDRIITLMPKTPVTENISFFGKADDQLFLRSPFFMHFQLPAIDKIDAIDFVPFFKDQFPFFKMKGFPIGVDGWSPFRKAFLK